MDAIAWGIYRTDNSLEPYDIVWFDADMDADTVRRSLIEHDGYPESIVIRK